MFKETTPTRNCVCCLLILGVVIVIPICVFFATVFDFGEDLKRLGKSFEFPAIEARAKPYGDLLGSITQDDLIKVERSTDNVSLSVTHPEHYTGIVDVTVRSIYGTNRPFESVQADFDRFFSARSAFAAEQFAGMDKYFKAVNQNGVACVYLSQTEKSEYPDSWAKYQVVYAIELHYLEPVKTCSLE